MTLTERWIELESTLASPSGLPCRTTCEPPWRSRPSTVGLTAMTAIDAASRPSTTSRKRSERRLRVTPAPLLGCGRGARRALCAGVRRARRDHARDRAVGDADVGVLGHLEQDRPPLLDLGHRAVDAGDGHHLVPGLQVRLQRSRLLRAAPLRANGKEVEDRHE